MDLKRLIARIWQPSQRPTPAQRQRVRLEVEGLEERRVMSGSQMAPALPQLAQAQQQSQPAYYYRYQVYSYKPCMGQQFCKRTEIYATRQQAEKRAQNLRAQGFCARVNVIRMLPSKVPVLGAPTMHS